MEAPSVLSSPVAWAHTADFLELTKPRITFLVVLTTLVGFYMGVEDKWVHMLLTHTVLGTALVAGGASAINMFLERKLDALMYRTIRRPLPSGRLKPGNAIVFALVISVAGILYLYIFVNALTSVLSTITLLSYALLYTPLKTKTWLCTLVGAVPGALPVTMGWAAATGGLSWGAWALFSIVFFWQIPHFYAIGWMYREDYARAGFPMLPVLDASGRRTGRQASLYTVILILASVGPFLLGITGSLYLIGAVAMGLLFLAYGVRFMLDRSQTSARRLFFASIGYLPALLALLMAGKVGL